MKIRVGLIGAVLALAAFNVSAASAATSCNYIGTTVFAPWGDTSLYTLASGANLESGSAGWSFWGNSARVIATDDNPLLGAGTHSVELAGASSAKSPAWCVDDTTPSMRFFVRRVSGNGSLTVKSTLTGSSTYTIISTFNGTSSWAPSPIVAFPNWGLTGSVTAQFVFQSTDANTTYRIDDVYIDPFRCC